MNLLVLDSLIEHVDDLIGQVQNLESDIDKIPYLQIQKKLRLSKQNYVNGLKIVRGILTGYIINRAKAAVQLPRKDGRVLAPDEIVYSYYRDQVSNSYRIIERYNDDFTSQAKVNIPIELYHLLLQIPKELGLNMTIILQESNQFISQPFKLAILDAVQHLLEIGKNPLIPGSLWQLPSLDLLSENPIQEGYVISYIKGEAENPMLWPVLIHEVFESIDMKTGLMDKLQESSLKAGAELPTLNEKDSEINRKWISEIFMDVMSIQSFGPMYAKSLLDYFKRAPYVKTIEYPEMSARLFCVYKYLETSTSPYTDILNRCINSCKGEVQTEISKYEGSGELAEDKKNQLSILFRVISEFFSSLGLTSFVQRLKNHVVATSKPQKFIEPGEEEMKFIPFIDPVFTYDRMGELIFDHHVSLAIDPNVLLNVVLANFHLFKKEEHLSVIVDSIRKWKIKEAWNASAKEVN